MPVRMRSRGMRQNCIAHTGWVTKTAQRAHGHNSVISQPILKVLLLEDLQYIRSNVFTKDDTLHMLPHYLVKR